MKQDTVYNSNVLGLGIAKQRNKTKNNTAMLSDWDKLCNGIGQGIQQHCFKMGIAQQCN